MDITWGELYCGYEGELKGRTTFCGLDRVEIGMGIDPNDTCVWVSTTVV